MKPTLFIISLLSVGLNAFAQDHHHEHPKTAVTEVTKAIAVLSPTKDSKVAGVITFTKENDKVRVSGKVEGLTPGKHGFHVHEFGDCSAVDATSAGGHFNPTGAPHGAQDEAKRHIGDLGNIFANENGVAEIDLLDEHLVLNGEHTIVGRGLIVHAKADDLKSQPTGDAGGRVACGVIGVAK